MRYNIIDVSVCDACIQLMCNGEIQDGENTARDCIIGQRGVWGDDARHFTPGSGEPFYSQSDCEGCGTSYHGDRHPAHVMIPLDKIREGVNGKLYVSSQDGSYTEVYEHGLLMHTIQRDWRGKLRRYELEAV